MSRIIDRNGRRWRRVSDIIHTQYCAREMRDALGASHVIVVFSLPYFTFAIVPDHVRCALDYIFYWCAACDECVYPCARVALLVKDDDKWFPCVLCERCYGCEPHEMATLYSNPLTLTEKLKPILTCTQKEKCICHICMRTGDTIRNNICSDECRNVLRTIIRINWGIDDVNVVHENIWLRIADYYYRKTDIVTPLRHPQCCHVGCERAANSHIFCKTCRRAAYCSHRHMEETRLYNEHVCESYRAVWLHSNVICIPQG